MNLTHADLIKYQAISFDTSIPKSTLVAVAAEVVAEARRCSMQLSLVIEGDTLQVANAMRFPIQNWSKFRRLVEDTRAVLDSLQS